MLQPESIKQAYYISACRLYSRSQVIMRHGREMHLSPLKLMIDGPMALSLRIAKHLSALFCSRLSQVELSDNEFVYHARSSSQPPPHYILLYLFINIIKASPTSFSGLHTTLIQVVRLNHVVSPVQQHSRLFASSRSHACAV